MDLIYTAYRSRGKSPPDWLQEGNTVCSVSSQNTLVFATTTQLHDKEADTWASHVYCTDVNTPWDTHLVISLKSPASCLAWDANGTRFVVADTSGNASVWSSKDGCLGDWKQIKTAEFQNENFVRAAFFPVGRPVSLNAERKDNVAYNEKFCHTGEGREKPQVDGCVLVSSTGLLAVIAFPPDAPALVTARSLGRGRRKIMYADMAITRDGTMIVATSGDTSPVSVYSVNVGLDSQAGYDVRVNTHSGFSVKPPTEGCEDPVRIRALKFVLSDCSDALVVGTDGPEGGRVQMWSLYSQTQAVHRLFQNAGPGRQRVVPEWRHSAEFSGGGARVVSLATPRTSVIGGTSPSCYIAVAFSDGSIQCLLRDSLQQIESVELPRSGNISNDNTKMSRANVTICDLCFTSTGNGLIATDSLGQLYLYRMSPITDPGGPYSVQFIVPWLEFCIFSGNDWWDLAIATKPSRIETVCDKLSENFSAQPHGLQQYYFSRYMAVKSSLYRLISSSQYRAADTTALLMLQSISGSFKSLLRPSDSGSPEHGPPEKLDIILRTKCKDETEVDNVILVLQASGISRDLSVETGTLQSLQQLAQWVTTLSLHLLASVPEYSSRRGPGYDLLQDQKALLTIRELLVMIRLWGVVRLPVITGHLWGGSGGMDQHNPHDLIAKLFSMMTRLRDQQEDEGLKDECLMLPSQVMIPPLDTVLSARGVVGSIHNHQSPLSFTYGIEPESSSIHTPPFLEGLVYTEQPESNFYYDSIQKMYLGQQPATYKKCTRCCGVTQANESNRSAFMRSWEKRWHRNCTCGGSWKTVKNTATVVY